MKFIAIDFHVFVFHDVQVFETAKSFLAAELSSPQTHFIVLKCAA